MLKNIVFDLGGVVVAHNEESFAEKLGEFFSFVFGPDMKCVPSFWCDYDLGVRTIDETAASVAEYRKCSVEEAKANMLYAISLQEEVEPTVRLIKELKERGYKLYVLSNMSKEYIEFLRKLSVFEYFDYEVVSCEVHLGKPNPEIYKYLLEHCGLNPSETIFIDDRHDNVEVAAELGITPFHFDRRNPEKACEELREIIYNN
ncbi:MAG: HAD family phosphatase [Alistipes sp.]|nr:HAD family phosphatase [Alistipes sp.]